MSAKTPPFGLPRPRHTFDSLHDRLLVLETDSKDQGERIARVETKQDVTIDLLRQMREDRTAERAQETVRAAETAQTERVRIGSRAKVIVGIATALGVIAGAVATVLAGGCS